MAGRWMAPAVKLWAPLLLQCGVLVQLAAACVCVSLERELVGTSLMHRRPEGMEVVGARLRMVSFGLREVDECRVKTAEV